jgi:hypothetical protein
MLVTLLGAKATGNVCYFAGGHRVPRYVQFRAWAQRVLLVRDYTHGGYTQRHLAAKYGLSITVVKKTLRAFERARLEARLADRYPAGSRGAR